VTRTRRTRTGQAARPVPDTGAGDRLLGVALAALEAVAGDASAPAAARAQAARTILEMRGAIGRNSRPPDDEFRPTDGMSAADLRAELARMRRQGAADRSTNDG